MAFNGAFIGDSAESGAKLTNLNVSNIAYGEIVRISSNVVDLNNVTLNNGTLSVSVNGKEYSADVANGTAIVEIPNLNAGVYTLNVKYAGGESFALSSITFNVSKQDVVISANDKSYIINYDGIYAVTLKDLKGNAVVGEKVVFTLNGNVIGFVNTNSEGVASVSLTAKTLKSLKAGKKNMIITLTSDNYNADAKTVKITISKEKTKITAKNKKFKSSKKTKKYTLILKNSKNNSVKKVKVTLKVKGKIYKAKTNAKGKATFNLKKLTKKGKYWAVVKFAGNENYKLSTKKVKITVEK